MLSLDIGIDHINNCLVIINIPHLNLNAIQPCPLCGMEPPVPTDDLIAALGAASHGQVGKDTVLPDAVHQLLHILIVTHLKRRLYVVVVFPVPPFWFAIAIVFILFPPKYHPC